MIYPQKQKLAYNMMSWYSQRILQRDFHSVNIIGDFKDAGNSVLVIGNHSGWWDGFWGLYVNNHLLKKNFYVLMLESELKKRMFFSKVGAYSINFSLREIKQSLLFTQQLLSESNNMVLFFPEGKFAPAAQAQKKFKKGISFFYKEGCTFTTIFFVALSDYFENRKPTVNLYIEEKNYAEGISNENMESDYNRFFMQCVAKQATLAS